VFRLARRLVVGIVRNARNLVVRIVRLGVLAVVAGAVLLVLDVLLLGDTRRDGE